MLTKIGYFDLYAVETNFELEKHLLRRPPPQKKTQSHQLPGPSYHSYHYVVTTLLLLRT